MAGINSKMWILPFQKNYIVIYIENYIVFDHEMHQWINSHIRTRSPEPVTRDNYNSSLITYNS